MSGIFGLYNQDGAPVTASEMRPMASLLERRGPDRTGLWRKGHVGLGHTLLATTQEAVNEHLPYSQSTSGCVITADARLDNRVQLLTDLNLISRASTIGDAEIILRAYLAWHESCVDHFLGDFAFAIYNTRQKTLFCARDHFGVRPFNYHYCKDRFFLFASEPRAILASKKASNKLNEGRIADFLITQLEGIDKTSTFFENIYRLPPAHTLTITPERMQIQQYWKLEPGPELHLKTEKDYAEAFLEAFTNAVRCRLRSTNQPASIGSMLSGGMDSGAVVAIAKELLRKEGKGPMPTFSATGPDTGDCIETRTILAAQSIEGIEPHTIRYDQLFNMLPELSELTWQQDEPFDCHMTLLRAVYLLAHRQGVKVVLDGIDGDSVLSEGSQLTRLLKRGRFLTAYREAVGQSLFWKGVYPAWQQLYQSSRSAFTPNIIRNLRKHLTGKKRYKKTVQQNINTSIINREFAQRNLIGQRLHVLNSHRQSSLSESPGNEAANMLSHPYLTVGIERYNRVASSLAIEPRHPWLDRRLVAFCLTLPGDQKLGDGWPKIILRRAMMDHLPDTIRWRRGKEHLGWNFTEALIKDNRAAIHTVIKNSGDYISSYINANILDNVLLSLDEGGEIDKTVDVFEAACLVSWLKNFDGVK